jgi:FecR protein
MNTLFKIISTCTLLLLSFTTQAEVAGSVVFIRGSASTTNAEINTVLSKGSNINTGDTIQTDGNGSLQLRMIDGAQVSLQPNTTYKVDDYVFKGQADGNERAFTSLVKGVLRTITGIIGQKNKQAYQLRTPTATIGVRGTEFSVKYDGATLVTVGEGAINFCNNSNCLDVFSGQSAIVDNPSAPPVKTDETVVQNKPANSNETIARNDFTPNDSPLVEALVETPTEPAVPVVPVVPVLPPLTTGSGGMGFIYSDTMAGAVGGLVGGTTTYNAGGAIVGFVDGTIPGNTLSAFTVAESYNNGIVAWGRWTTGTGSGGWAPTTTQAGFHYYSGQVSPSAIVLSTLNATYNVVGSTAPTSTDASNIVTAGTPNLVTGSLSANFIANAFSYSLTNIKVGGETFSIIGNATLFSGSSLLGNSSTITSTGGSCTSPPCSGNIPSANAFQASFFGANAEFAGANYGFSTSLGNKIGGAVVFARP